MDKNFTASFDFAGGLVIDEAAPPDTVYVVPSDWKEKIIAHEMAMLRLMSARIENVTA